MKIAITLLTLNAPNRVVLTREARPGQAFDIAVFAANGPLSDPPANHLWVRSAAIDFYRPRPDARRVHVTVGQRDARASWCSPTRQCSNTSPVASSSPRAPSGIRRTNRCSSRIRTTTPSTGGGTRTACRRSA